MTLAVLLGLVLARKADSATESVLYTGWVTLISAIVIYVAASETVYPFPRTWAGRVRLVVVLALAWAICVFEPFVWL